MRKTIIYLIIRLQNKNLNKELYNLEVKKYFDNKLFSTLC